MTAHTLDNLAGAWKLVSASASTASGERADSSFGPSPMGTLLYTPEGRMAVMVSNGGRKLLPADPFLASVEERAEAFTTFFAYAGGYTLAGDKVIHHVEISSLQSFVGMDLVRLIKFQLNRISLVSPPMSINGETQILELVWERVPASS
ncbi:MAG: lipocalin-like domain-containing protein [Candidatus Acidiferrum sp.]